MSTIKNNTSDTTSKGSFLLELLIAFAVISIALTVVVDSFVSSQKSYRIIADQTYLTQALTTVLEDIARETRVSDTFECGIGVTSPCGPLLSTFSMAHVVGLNAQTAGDVVYTLNGAGEITKNGIKMTTSSKIIVTQFTVEIKGTHGVDQVQAFVTLTAHTVNNPNEVHVQTSYTERMY